MRCKNGPEHTHETSDEARRCWAARYSSPHSTAPIAASMAESNSSNPTNPSRTAQTMPDPRLDFIKGMIDLIPNGYYATQTDEGHVDFFRIWKVEKATRRFPVGTVKIQTQHAERWEEAIIFFPSGYDLVLKTWVIPKVLEVIADHHACARRYSIEVQACCSCGTTLTDDRSRHYLIGPICDQKPSWAWVIQDVDEKNNGMSFEELVARGLPTRVWQEQAVA